MSRDIMLVLASFFSGAYITSSLIWILFVKDNKKKGNDND